MQTEAAKHNPIVTCKGAPNLHRPIRGQWQVVFKTRLNRANPEDCRVVDYCREQPPLIGERHMTEAEVMAWAKRECVKHGLHGAVIDWY